MEILSINYTENEASLYKGNHTEIIAVGLLVAMLNSLVFNYTDER